MVFRASIFIHFFNPTFSNNQIIKGFAIFSKFLALDATETLMMMISQHRLPALGPSFKGGGQKDDPNIKGIGAIRLSSCWVEKVCFHMNLTTRLLFRKVSCVNNSVARTIST